MFLYDLFCIACQTRLEAFSLFKARHPGATGSVDEQAFKVLRILKRENGEWKVHRAIWNELGEEAEAL